MLDGARHCLSEVLPLGLEGLRLVSIYWGISGNLMIYICTIVALTMLMEDPVFRISSCSEKLPSGARKMPTILAAFLVGRQLILNP